MAIDDYISELARNAGQAPRDETISRSFHGLNIVGRNAPISVNTENHGFTFFTRPNMNMSYNNLVIDRILSTLLVDDHTITVRQGSSESQKTVSTVQRMIRSYLDPELVREGVDARGIDPHNVFIPLLSNNLISLSGWPDFTLNTSTTQPGLYREAYSYVDDVPYNYEAFDLQASFRNLAGDPISYLLLIWGWYMGLVYEGRIMPRPENVLYNRIDYNTRIYRLITDPSRTYVTRIGACGAGFPMTAPIGNVFNFDGDGSQTPFTTANDQITVNFRCMGFTYYDPILIYEFNTAVAWMQNRMQDTNRERLMQKLRPHEREYFNYHAYPRINEFTMELEWWVDKRYYEAQKAGVIHLGV